MLVVKKITSPKSKGEIFQQINSPQKNPKKKYMLVVKKLPRQNLREKYFSKLTHFRKIQRKKNASSKKVYLAKI